MPGENHLREAMVRTLHDGDWSFDFMVQPHSLAEHRPLGNSDRARRRMYHELAVLRQAMNAVAHREPTGEERFA